MHFSPTTQPLTPLPWAFPVVGERTAVAVKLLQRGRYGIEYNTGRGTKSGRQRPIMSILLPAFTFHELLLSRLIIIIAEYCKFVYIHKCCIINMNILNIRSFIILPSITSVDLLGLTKPGCQIISDFL